MRLVRTTAAALAISVCALLFGLSYAHDSRPGDVIQFVRSAPSHTAPVLDLAAAKKVDPHPAAHQLVAVLPAGVRAPAPVAPGCPAPVERAFHIGRCIGAPGCRGPPSS